MGSTKDDEERGPTYQELHAKRMLGQGLTPHPSNLVAMRRRAPRTVGTPSKRIKKIGGPHLKTRALKLERELALQWLENKRR